MKKIIFASLMVVILAFLMLGATAFAQTDVDLGQEDGKLVMNAVIVDIRKKQAAALDESGRVVRIRNANYGIGQRIKLYAVKPVRRLSVLKRISSGVAAAVLVAMIGTGTAYAMPYGTVTLEGDTSIEYTINCFDYVPDVQAANEEGEAVLAEMDIKQLRHHRIDKAVSATVEQMERGGHLDAPEGRMQISADTRSEGHTDKLQRELDTVLREESGIPAPGESGAPAASHQLPEGDRENERAQDNMLTMPFDAEPVPEESDREEPTTEVCEDNNREAGTPPFQNQESSWQSEKAAFEEGNFAQPWDGESPEKHQQRDNRTPERIDFSLEMDNA